MNEQKQTNQPSAIKKIVSAIGGDKLVLMGAIIIVFIVFTSFNENFLSWTNIVNVMVGAHLIGIVAIGHTYLIIAGQNDLSPGSVSAFAAVISALLMSDAVGLSLGMTLLVTVLSGAVIGLFNAWMVNSIKLQAFIATLVTQSIVRSLAFIICDGRPIPITDAAFRDIGKLRDPLMNIPYFVWITIVCFAIFGFILARTKFGRSLYAIGGNEAAARLAGLRPKRIITISYVIMGVLTSLGGMIFAARMNTGQPSAGINLEFDAITAVILGGVSFTGGVGSMGGTVLGVLLIQFFNTGLIMIEVPSFWHDFARGGLLLFALASDYIRKQRREKELLAASMKTM